MRRAVPPIVPRSARPVPLPRPRRRPARRPAPHREALRAVPEEVVTLLPAVVVQGQEEVVAVSKYYQPLHGISHNIRYLINPVSRRGGFKRMLKAKAV